MKTLLDERKRLKVRITGAVQGVGFRPFVFRSALKHGLGGWVRNTASGVEIEAEGRLHGLQDFLICLQRDKPAAARIYSLEPVFLDPCGLEGFQILASAAGPKEAVILPDLAVCSECLAEMRDPADRRYRYPFINCTHCGPRYSILESLPYDRARTSMKKFRMCAACREEYENTADRRFHAQPVACPACGPHLEVHNRKGRVLTRNDHALMMAARALRSGLIVAVKGLSGFHLMTDASDFRAVDRLRTVKRRECKPFAVMAPSLQAVREVCEVSPFEERLLLSSEAPLVLLRRRPGESAVSPLTAPGNPFLAVMLPSNPLHVLLAEAAGRWLVATSGNPSEEPLIADEKEAFEKLKGMADLFLVHDRPIVNPVDDSIVRVVLGRELVLRRARGYAPLPVPLEETSPAVMAVGGEMKSTVAFSRGPNIFITQHLGNLDNEEAFRGFQQAAKRLAACYGFKPETVVHDLHPDYRSTREAGRFHVPRMGVQHHHAHILACMAENEVHGTVLGMAWDGTGFGSDGTLWGGEFLEVSGTQFRRLARLRHLMLLGGDRAVKEPRRSAYAVLHEVFEGRAIPEDAAPMASLNHEERRLFDEMLRQRFSVTACSSMGRLFDAAASLLGLCQIQRFEAEAAMAVEFAVDPAWEGEGYSFPAEWNGEESLWVLDWRPLFSGMLEDLARGETVGRIAARFHQTLAGTAVSVAQKAGLRRICLGGGCFQNAVLLERVVTALERAGFKVYWPQRVPPNDGGLALGQVVYGAACLGRKNAQEVLSCV